MAIAGDFFFRIKRFELGKGMHLELMKNIF